MTRNTLLTLLLTAGLTLPFAPQPVAAQNAAPPAMPSDASTMPIFRLEPGGPNSLVTALAVSPSGNTLFEAGWDKVVRSWSWDAADKQFRLDAPATYRVPIGPGMSGVINALAVSPDGDWLAVAGVGLVRGASDLQHAGFKVPTAGTMTPAMREDQGVIYLFNTRTRQVRTLRGPTAPVMALAFAPARPGKPLVLVSAGQEWDKANNRFAGSVRAWEALSGTYLGGVTLRDVTRRPTLAPYHTGAAAKQMNVAIAWGDEQATLHVWDVAGNRLRDVADGQYNTVAWWGTPGRLITTSGARVKQWSVPASGDGLPTMARELALGNADIPRAMALYSSKPGGAIDRAALVVRRGAGDMRLRLVDLDRFQLLPQADFALWQSADITPTIAATPNGSQLMLAGNPAQEIVLLATSDLVAGRYAPTALRGAGLRARGVAFARSGASQGLVIQQAGKPQPGGVAAAPSANDLVFDVTRRRILRDASNWQSEGPKLESWNVSSQFVGTGQQKHVKLSASDGRGQSFDVTLPVGQQLTDFALLPSFAPLARPLLAVASHDRGQPALVIYDLRGGAAVRELTGHIAPIDCVAFSEDGLRLVSLGSDRTLSVWNLDDLPQVIDKRGALIGVAVERNGQEVVVLEVAADSPLRGGPLAAGDVLMGWTTEGRQEPIGSPLDFYLHASHLKPGTMATLLRKRGQAAAAPANITIGQGTDERKPLFSLFITEPAAGGKGNWIAWNPLGPYDSSGPEIEQSLGWHFNTGQAARPTRFAAAGEYETFRREGLIEQLLKTRSLEAPAPAALSRPTLSIRLKQASPGLEVQAADGHGALRLAGAQAELHVEVHGLPASQIAGVRFVLAGGSPLPLSAISQRVWTAQLSDLPLGKEPLTARVEVTTSEREPQTFSEELSLAYQPSAPLIEQVRPAGEQVVDQPALRFQAQVRSLAGPQTKLRIRLIHVAAGQEIESKELDAVGQQTIDASLTLKPGDNLIRLSAANADVPAADTLEQAVVVRRITFSPARTAPPKIDLAAVVPASGVRLPIPIDQDRPLVVDTTEFRLEGAISSEQTLRRAEWLVGDAAMGTSFTGFSGNPKSIDIHETISLKPGPQTIRCVAQSDAQPPTEISLVVDYRPQLPELMLTAPASGGELIAGRDAQRVQLAARIVKPGDPHPFRAIVWLNGHPLAAPATVDLQAGSISAEVPLHFGENRLEVQLVNEWGGSRSSEPAYVRFRRPPQIVEIIAPAQSDGPLAEVTVLVDSPRDLKLTGFKVNDREVPASSAVLVAENRGTNRWKFTVADVPLVQGANEIRPLARNADGWSVLTKTAPLDVKAAPAAKAEVQFLSPRVDRTVDAAKFDVQFEARSSSRLRRVELRNGDALVESIDVQAQKEAPAAGRQPASYVLRGQASVPLAALTNRLQVVAVNDGGQSTANVTVTYVPRPVEVIIDRIAAVAQPDKTVAPTLGEGGKIVFAEPAGDGNVWLHGHVRWSSAESQQLNRASVVEVAVNGFLQSPVPLDIKEDSLTCEWRAKIRLNRSHENQIAVRLPGTVEAADNRLDFAINCAQPDQRQRLHLFVVGIDDQDARQLESTALGAVQGKRTQGEQITTPAFSQGWIYLISGYVNRGRITAQLDRIHLRIGDARTADAANDVVVVYYRGQEAVDPQGQFYLLTSQSQFDQDTQSSAVSGRDLADRFAAIPGAQLFLFDVKRSALGVANAADVTPASPRWPSQSNTAALRYVWLEKDTQPADARLLDAVSGATPAARELGALESQVSQDSRRVQSKYGNSFAYEQRVPGPLRGLVLSR